MDQHWRKAAAAAKSAGKRESREPDGSIGNRVPQRKEGHTWRPASRAASKGDATADQNGQGAREAGGIDGSPPPGRSKGSAGAMTESGAERIHAAGQGRGPPQPASGPARRQARTGWLRGFHRQEQESARAVPGDRARNRKHLGTTGTIKPLTTSRATVATRRRG